MNKNDLKLIAAFIDSKNPKLELNYAHLKSDGIYATDTRKLIKFCVPMLGLDLLLEKRILNGFVSTMTPKCVATIDGFGFIRSGDRKMSCDTFARDKVEPVDFDKILDATHEHCLNLENIDELQFELSQRNCFIDEEHLNPIIKYSECSKFTVFYTEQKEVLQNGRVSKHCGTVKIVGKYSTEDESNIVKFIAVIMGRTFVSKAIEE